MSEFTEAQIAALAKLREPIPQNQINYLPKQISRDDKVKGTCEDTPQGRAFSFDRIYCGGYHAKSLHIAYFGHADLTSRLLDVDPDWDWEPFATDERGLPVLDREGGLWIRLTVAGKTRIGYGDAQGKSGPNAVKEAIGDALRNAGMRFGIALDLWSKSDLHADTRAAEDREWITEATAATDADGVRSVWLQAKAAGADLDTLDKISVIGREFLEGANS